MTENESNVAPASAVPDPVDGKFIFQIAPGVRIRFNADGWVEEIGKGGPEDPLGTLMQGKSGTKRDDIYARRYYDLYTRCLIIDIHPKISTDMSGAEGLVMFKDLDPDSPTYDRVNLIIAIANHHFSMNLKPLAA